MKQKFEPLRGDEKIEHLPLFVPPLGDSIPKNTPARGLRAPRFAFQATRDRSDHGYRSPKPYLRRAQDRPGFLIVNFSGLE